MGGEDLRRCVTIINKRGLHARAAAKFVKLAGQFDASVTVTRNGQEVSGLSIMGLMMFAAGPGTEVEISARGPEGAAALDALEELIDRRFDED
ncbi:MAG: HPr family phosphocarrier protein [Rhodospirillales bacterium]|nr:HPr family phosphocarrier protein [Rhodospirillales bacterium]MCW8862184.1 HPr family phosphocarrier protein [Rhodospirillales bacterium]MCW8953235.1 HPr family phosphocarrier protein [Rhodospirillales bacterium]MCW8970544.1 HPr family phosphocarrier protein [Rhodospirillales bacterium]MCW9002752.1 HPr family phosphocarrier protein [Rhodospirillales bacterium]